MTIVQILLVIMVISLIVGPIMAMRPNPDQKRKERIRMAARSMGLSFRITRLPKLSTETNEGETIACYFLQPTPAQLLRSEWMLRRTDYPHEANFYAEWDWTSSVKPCVEAQEYLRTQMISLPRDVKAISAGPSGTSVYWQEKGDEVVLADLLDLLRRIAAFEDAQSKED